MNKNLIDNESKTQSNFLRNSYENSSKVCGIIRRSPNFENEYDLFIL